MTDAEAGPPTLEADKDARLYGMLCHLLALSAVIGIPVGWVLGPLVMWLIKKDQYRFVDQEGKEAINFGITVAIAMAICLVTFWLILPIFVAIGIGIAAAILNILAALKANEGVGYRYPFTIRFLK